MDNDSKNQIYKNIIQYLLESTHYDLKNIAILTNSTIKNIRDIYCGNEISTDLKSEIALLHLYQIVLEARA